MAKTRSNCNLKSHSLFRRFLSSLGISSKNKIGEFGQISELECVENKMTQTEFDDHCNNRGDFKEERFFDLTSKKFRSFEDIQPHLKKLTCSMMLTNLDNKDMIQDIFTFVGHVTVWLYYTFGRNSDTEMDLRMEKSQVAASTFTRFYKQLKM